MTPIALILDGHVAIRRTSLEGRQLIVRIINRGKLGAFIPLVARPSAGDFVALSAAPVALWSGPWVRSLAKADPGLAVDLIDQVVATYEEIVGRLDSLLYQNALRRVARILQMHADLFFADEPVLTRDYLPTMVGTSREMTGRVLRILEARSIVARVDRNRLRLLDPERLAAIAADTSR
jgi:CRP-like cAMP-binding protein